MEIFSDILFLSAFCFNEACLSCYRNFALSSLVLFSNLHLIVWLSPNRLFQNDRCFYISCKSSFQRDLIGIYFKQTRGCFLFEDELLDMQSF